MNRVILIASILVTASVAGCIDQLTNAFGVDAEENIDPATNDPIVNATDPVTGNLTEPDARPPVARISVYAPSGALVYEADFVAENRTDNGIVIESGVHTFLASGSAVIDGRATLEKYEWDINGKKFEGRKVDHEFERPGIHMVTLTVTDSLGSKDSQMIHLVQFPTPFEHRIVQAGEAVPNPAACYVMGSTGSAVHEFEITHMIDDKHVEHESLRASLTGVPETTTGFHIVLYDADGEVVVSSRPLTGTGSIGTEALPAGAYTIEVTSCGGAPAAHELTIVLEYVEMIPELSGMDGHAHQH